MNQHKRHALFSFDQNPMYVDDWKWVEKQLRINTNTVTLIDGQKIIKFKQTIKPKWADRIWQNSGGLHAAHEDGTEFQLIPATKKGESAKWEGIHNAWDWASDYGIDECGLWAILTVKDVDFKLRWIHAGSFLMGSPKDEKGRRKNETQHEVTLTKGYWLAETTVTQAQWQSVMSKNPSEPKNSKLPVNNISWHDCKTFLEKLQKRAPDFKAKLPTEAQWEYACRAESQTTYWWGDTFDESKANKSNKLKPESEFSQNKFGLRSMSGNVYEWCNDGMSNYSKEAVENPEGATDSSRRVLRGGCWFDHAQNLRSADRDADSPDFRYRLIGMRLAGGFDPQAGSSDCKQTADRRSSAEPVRRQSTIADNPRSN